MAFDPLTAILDVGKTVIDKVLPDKMSEAEKMQVKQAFSSQLAEQALTANRDFRNFILEYEGAAKDIPKGLVWFRSIIRPLFTIAVGYWDYLFFSGAAVWPVEKVGLLKAINIIVLLFWFGERAVKNSGIIDMLKRR